MVKNRLCGGKLCLLGTAWPGHTAALVCEKAMRAPDAGPGWLPACPHPISPSLSLPLCLFIGMQDLCTVPEQPEGSVERRDGKCHPSTLQNPFPSASQGGGHGEPVVPLPLRENLGTS